MCETAMISFGYMFGVVRGGGSGETRVTVTLSRGGGQRLPITPKTNKKKVSFLTKSQSPTRHRAGQLRGKL